MAWIVGMGVGTLAMAMLNLLYSRSDPHEVGRASAAHQYLRNLFLTYATALAGTILLVVVRARVGEVEAIRHLLAGETVAGGDLAAESVSLGFRLAHSVPLTFAVGERSLPASCADMTAGRGGVSLRPPLPSLHLSRLMPGTSQEISHPGEGPEDHDAQDR